MRDLDDTALERRLREVLEEHLGALPLDLTVDALDRRREARGVARRFRRGRGMTLLAAAALLGYAGNRMGMHRVIDLAREMPDEFHRLVHEPVGGGEQALNLGPLRDRLPWFTRSFAAVKARKIEIAVKMVRLQEALGRTERT